MRIRSLVKKHLPRSSHLLLRALFAKRKKTVSQMGQDFWVFGEVFNGMENGFFLEVGSADGITFSNTFLLEKRYGWRGICIEPNPLLFNDLRRVRNAICLNVCVDSQEGEVDFVHRDVLGGIVDNDTDNKREAIGITQANIFRLKTKTLSSILKSENAPHTIDYFSIDVEGAEDRVLCEFPFDEYKFKSMTIERPKPRLREVLARNGYLSVKEIPNHDVFYIHQSFYREYERNIFQFWSRHLR